MQNKMRLVFVLIIIGAAFAANNARLRYIDQISDERSIQFKLAGSTAYVNGVTGPLSYGKVKKFLKNNPQVDIFVLEHMPGTRDSFTNLKIARYIRKKGIKTQLGQISFIASGGVDLFIAGAERTMECGARIAVHSWSVGGNKFRFSPNDLRRDEHRPRHEKFLSDMGVDPAFYVFTREASEPESVHIMTNEEIARYGLLTKSVDCE